jgi:putative peptidoglycan lipid II flippase
VSEKKRSLANIAGIVAAATLVSKLFGLVRQVVVAAAFGVGNANGAFLFASLIPNFFVILLGGINGPFHSALVSVLAKRDRKEAAPILESVSTIVGLALLIPSVLVFIFAPQLLTIFATGLATKAPEVREIAIQQLRIMAPTAWFAGMIGIGFGALNAVDIYWLPSVSPLISSSGVIVAVGVLWLLLGSKIGDPDSAMLGGIALAIAFLAGTILQWLVQVIVQRKEGLGRLRFRFDLQSPAVKEVQKVMGPALFASGMLQINLYTGMFFLSFVDKPATAVAALDYSNLLVQTPLGILSNMILVPLFPLFSKLSAPEHWPDLRQRIRQGMLMTAIAMLPLGAFIMALATPIVRVVYERGAFDPEASRVVAAVLMAYAVGMFVYLGRDVLVRVFYGLGDGDTPFRISVVNIFVNAVLDYLLVGRFGAPGVVMATVCVNIFSTIALTYFLDRKLNGVGWQNWAMPIVGLTLISFIAGAASWGVSWGLQFWWDTHGWLFVVVKLAIAGGIGLGLFLILVTQLKLPEVDLFVEKIKSRLPSRFARR